jgi:hypothetical protein
LQLTSNRAMLLPHARGNLVGVGRSVPVAGPGFNLRQAQEARVAAHASATGHHRWLNQAGSRQCEHGNNGFPHRASLHSVTPEEYNTFTAGLFVGRTSFAVN